MKFLNINVESKSPFLIKQYTLLFEKLLKPLILEQMIPKESLEAKDVGFKITYSERVNIQKYSW